ncbi:MAG: PTS mannose/fructose/sorbose/N-acetylgalactosamine transporter subunit IIC [Lachnospiraceae bacterium]
MGAALELVFLGITSIGGTMPSDALTGSVLGSAFAIITNSTTEVALALAIPSALISQLMRNVFEMGLAYLLPLVDKYIAQGKERKVFAIHFGSIFAMSLFYFIIGFLGIALGSNTMQAVVDAIPDRVMAALTAVSMLLPALGIALLMKMVWEKKTAVFLLLGFVLVGYFDLPLMALALIGIVIAVVIALQDMEQTKNVNVMVSGANQELSVEEDFFND